MDELLHTVAGRAARYLLSLPHRKVAPSPQAIAALARFVEPMPPGPEPPELVIRLLDEFGSPATMAMGGPSFFGFVIGGSLPAALAATWLASAWGQNAGLYVSTPGTATLAEVAMGWLIAVLALPP